MKNKLLFAAGAMLLAATVLVSVCVNNGNDSMEAMFNANVEALARAEGGGSSTMCSQTGNSGSYYMKLCSRCKGSFGYYAMDSVAYCH